MIWSFKQLQETTNVNQLQNHTNGKKDITTNLATEDQD